MNKHPKYSLVSVGTFFIGLMTVAIWFFAKSDELKPETRKTVQLIESLSEVRVGEKQIDESVDPLAKIWMEDQTLTYEDYTITKKNVELGDGLYNESLEFKRNGKKIEKLEVESITGKWISFGWFNFLGKDDRQLVFHIYSGGAHCCDDYIIYDLKPTFRVIYDSRKYDSGSVIGNELFPVDIDNDGIFEFTRSVMTFDYFHASHADSVFPPALFGYDERKRHYVLANKKFSDYVIKELKEDLRRAEKSSQSSVNSEHLTEIHNRYIIRKTFLNMIYAGKQKEAWEYFGDEYNFLDKEEFAQDVKKELSRDVTYQSIYSK